MTIIVVGNGPAGISAAIYAVRGGAKTLVLGKGTGALGKTQDIENYYGFPDAISGSQLLKRGIAQAKRLGVQLQSQEVVGIGIDERLSLTCSEQIFSADAVILATGASRKMPQVKGIESFEGRGVSHCALCDAFFYRGQDVAVWGGGDFAMHEAQSLLPIVGSVTLLTNGQPPSAKVPDGVRVIEKPVKELSGDETLENIEFEDGSSIAVSGVFLALGVAGSAALARKVGAATDGNSIVVNEQMETNIPGLYAAGDCVGGLMQIAKAVHQGAVAGMQALKYARLNKKSL